MFHSARLHLTGWYLLIIMLISISFSVVIYKVLSVEVQRFDRLQRGKLERTFTLTNPSFSPAYPATKAVLVSFDPELLSETQRRLTNSLIFINTLIFVLAGGLGYWLAGRTLWPIKEMIEEQNQFITDSSHELRTPLTSLKSGLEIGLRDTELTLADARQVMTESIEEVNKLVTLSDGLLQLAQYQKPQNRTTFTTVSLAEVSQKAVNQVKTLAKNKQQVIKNNIQNLKLEANPDGLQDLLVILIDNAIKYSPDKSTITLSSQKTDGSVKIRVSDEGIGIADHDQTHIFDRFYRADLARSKSVATGYGLGLSIAKKIVATHQGTLTVASQEKKGSTFTVTLPLKH